MHEFKTLTAALAATTIFVGGLAYSTDHARAADQSNASGNASQQQQATLGSDAQKMSKDAQIAFADVGHARLSLFDGDVTTAKKLLNNASAAFDRAKTDRSVFMKAASDLESTDQGQRAANTGATQSGNADAKGNNPSSSSAANGDKSGSTNKPVAWLPVDGAISVNEDFQADSSKSAAVKDANQKLADGDRKGAIEKLKIAHVDVDLMIAAVPVDQTSKDIAEAAKLIKDGKYYETSQVLRLIENSVHYANLDLDGSPKSGHQNGNASSNDSGSATTR